MQRLNFVAVVWLTLALGVPSGAAAATITVDTFAQGDQPGCSLAEAITAANNDTAGGNGCADGSGADTIVLPAGTYTLAVADNTDNGLPIVTSAITLQGAGAATTIIARDPAAMTAFRILRVDAGNLTLNDVTIQGGSGVEGAGVFVMAGALTVNNSTFTVNAAGMARGGAVSTGNTASAMITITNSTFSNNSGNEGGALFVFGTLTLSDTTFANNTSSGSGGALSLCGGTATLTDTAFNDNNATADAGALLISSSCAMAAATVTLSGGSFTLNRADGTGGGGAISNSQTLTISDAPFSSNMAPAGNGGALRNTGTLTVTGSTLEANTAMRGGALAASPGQTTTLRNTTVSGNSALTDGGGVWVEGGGTLTLNNVTLTQNTADSDNSGSGEGGGLFRASAATGVNLSNTILAENTDRGGQSPDCFTEGTSSLTSQGFNLVGNNAACSVPAANGDQIGTSMAPIDPRLNRLADNGGPTRTHALTTASPAVDAGNNLVAPGNGGAACEAADQRGVVRPVGAACDIGAFEGAVAASADLIVSKSDAPDPVPVTTNITYTVSVANAGPSDATSVMLIDTLPAGVTFVSATPSMSCSEAMGTVTCTLGSINGGSSTTATIVVTPPMVGAISNTATAIAAEPDLNLADNIATAETTVVDFTISVTPASFTVTAGQPATYTITITPVGGAFQNLVTFSCTNLPTGANCSAPGVLPGAVSITSTLTVTTTATSAHLAPLGAPQPYAPVYAAWFVLPGLLVMGVVLLGREAGKRRLRSYLALGLLLVLLALAVACGGGGAEPTPPATPPAGTPRGTHTITVTGASGSLMHSAMVDLVVQ